jgi:hypothetical protein
MTLESQVKELNQQILKEISSFLLVKEKTFSGVNLKLK